MIEEAINTWLLTQTQITAYIGADIYFLAAPDLLESDFIRYQIVAPSNEPYSFVSSNTAQPDIQFDIFSKYDTRCVEIGTLLATALNRLTGSFGGMNIIFSTASGPMVERDLSNEQWWHGIVYWTPEYER